MKIQPINRKVFLKVPKKEPEDKTKHGIYIPESAKDKKPPMIGKVFEAADDCEYVKSGDTVIFLDLGFEPVQVGEEEYLVGSEDNIFAILT